MLEEAGVDYHLEHVDFAKGETREERFLAINPNGRVPVLVDNGQVLFESLAINLYLAKRYATHLWPASLIQQSQLFQWLAWVMGEFEGPHDAANRANSTLDPVATQQSLNVLRRTLTDQPYLFGCVFTVADLNTACVLMRPQLIDTVRNDPQLRDWFRRCRQRPALKRAVAERA